MLEYLSHHGILGQKWGVRRYQNKDGTYTDLGRKRIASEQERLAVKAAKKALSFKNDAKRAKELADEYEKSKGANIQFLREYRRLSEGEKKYYSLKERPGLTSDRKFEEQFRDPEHNWFHRSESIDGYLKTRVSDLRNNSKRYEALSKEWMNRSKAITEMTIDEAMDKYSYTDLNAMLKNKYKGR